MRNGSMRLTAGVWVAGVALVLIAARPASGSAVGATFEETLPNGLRVIYIQHRANPMVASSVIVGAGVVDEVEGMNGASHFLEHLLFNGTERRTQRELYDEVDRYGAYNNATTREDHTLFTLLVQKEFVGACLDVQADMLFHSTLPVANFEKEKGIVLEELAKDENDPEYLARSAFRAFAFAGTPLARPVLGSRESIEKLSRERVLAYYKSRYVPSNMTLVLMGDFELADMKAAVARTFGSAVKGKVPSVAALRWPKAPEANLARRAVDAGTAHVYAAAPLPLAPFDADLAAVELLVAAMAGEDDAPLQRAMSHGEPLTLSSGLAVTPRLAPWSTLEFEAVASEGRSGEEVLEKLVATLRSPSARAEARERIELVRAGARADEVLTADQIHYYALMRASYVPGSPPGYLTRRLSILDGIDDAALDRAERTLLQAADAFRYGVIAPKLREETVAWRAPAAPADAVAAADGDRPIHRGQLDSGLTVAAERNDDSRVLAVHVLTRPRCASEPAGKEGIADFLHRLLLRGTLVNDRAALAARLHDLGARVKTHDDASIPFDDYYTTPEFSFVRLEMPADRWREGISLLGEVMRFPRLDAAEIESVRREMLDVVRRRAGSTRSRAQELTARTLAPGHPLSRPISGTAESIAAITADDLRAFHASYFTGQKMIVTEVGPIDPRQVFDAVAGAFGSLPKGDAPPTVAPVPVTAAGITAEETLGKDQASVGLACVFDSEPADLAALEVAGALISDKIAFRLREEQGLAYSISASIGRWGGRTRFDAVMATRQENIDTVIAGLRSEISAFVAAEPDEAAVSRAANAMRGRALMRRLTRVNQAYFAGLALNEGRAPADDLDRLARLLAVRAGDVKRVTRRYLDLDRCARIVVR